MRNIQPEEIEIVGYWVNSNGTVVADENCARIEELTSGRLEEVAATDGGWSKLYRDPEDGRYWELTYPHSDWQGGGPPTLLHLTEAEVETKYGKIQSSP